MIIAQITDTHLTASGTLHRGAIAVNDKLRAVVQRLNELTPGPDVILVTGDLTANGEPEEYEQLRDILGEAKAPVYLIPGNHDDRDDLRAHFPRSGYLPAEGFAHYVVDDYPVALIGLDTTASGTHRGEMCAERLAWLEARLDERRDKPVLIFMHHPPFRSGIWWMDAIGLKGRRKLARLVSRYDNIERVVCGHLHRPIQTRWAGTVGSVAPSAAFFVALDLGGQKFMTLHDEPAGYDLHLWNERDGLVTHTCSLERSEGFVPEGLLDPEALNKLRAELKRIEAEIEAADKLDGDG